MKELKKVRIIATLNVNSLVSKFETRLGNLLDKEFLIF